MATTAVQRGLPVVPPEPRGGRALVVAAWVLAALLPLVGFLSLILREQLDPNLNNPELHFLLFLAVGAGLLIIAYDAGESAERRGDARVLLISLAFLATGAFLMLHSFGTAGVLFEADRAGFKIAIPVGLLISAGFAVASAFVDARPGFAPMVGRRRRVVRVDAVGASAAGPGGERGRDERRPGRARRGGDARLRGRGGALPGRLPRAARPAAGQHRRRLRPAGRGDDRRGDHGRGGLARELVGVARADRARVRRRRLRRPARVARRALPQP